MSFLLARVIAIYGPVPSCKSSVMVVLFVLYVALQVVPVYYLEVILLFRYLIC